MKNLIIPCASGKKINGIPFYLNKYPLGNLLVFKAIEGMEIKEYPRIIIAILVEDDIKYNAKRKIIEEALKLGLKIEVVVLESTRDVVETIYLTIKKAKLRGQLIIKDSSNYIKLSEIKYKNFIGGLDINRYNKEIKNIKSMSFIKMNDKQIVLDIVEKKIISENIGIGLYGFEESCDFLYAYSKLKDKFYPIQKLFLSHIISYLIGYKNKNFYYEEVSKFESWRTKEDWYEICNQKTNYFINLDSLFGDNLEFYNNSKKVILIKKLLKRKVKLIFLTSKNKQEKERIEKFLSEDNNKLNILYNYLDSSKNFFIRSEQELLKLEEKI